MIFSTQTLDFLQWLSTQKYSQLVVLVDENTQIHCYPILEKQLPTHFLVKIPAGEQHKNLQTCVDIWTQYTALQLDRKALALHLGGGVVGDMGGFCASIYKRGIRFVQIPTTLLAQVDASVGGKLGIDFQHFKNHLGVFQNPEIVWINTTFLETLPKREKKSGFAEMLKHGIILSENHWQTLTNTSENKGKNKNYWENQDWENVIKQSITLKNEVVTNDFKEENIRKLLNFGHTVGHGVESYALSHNISLLHGEAVAIGMQIEAFLAYKKGLLNENSFLEITNYLADTYFYDGLFKSILNKNDIEKAFLEILSNAIQDKKNNTQKIFASLPISIGKGTFDVEITKNQFLEGLEFFFI